MTRTATATFQDLRDHVRRQGMIAPFAPVGPANADRLRAGVDQGLLDRAMTALQRHTGLRIDGGHRPRVARMLAERGDSAYDWLRRLEAPGPLSDDLAGFIEDLTVHETYFFRDRPQMEQIRSQVLLPLVRDAAQSDRPRLRLWSAACATGEEAYSLAMMVVEAMTTVGAAQFTADGRILLDPRWSVRILATDLSHRAIAATLAASYAATDYGAFRRMPAGYDRFFEDLPPQPAGGPPLRRVRPELRTLVSATPFNLMSGQPPACDLDLVLCRNVLIYFAADTAARVMGLLHTSLRRGGYLALGASDMIPPDSRFVSLWSDASVLHRRLD